MTRRETGEANLAGRAPHSHGRHSHVLNLGGDRVVPVPLSDLTNLEIVCRGETVHEQVTGPKTVKRRGLCLLIGIAAMLGILFGVVARSKIDINPKFAAEVLRSPVDHAK
jgi:hypothetical protein